MSLDDKGPWIETYSGKKFYFLAPTPDQIHIGDIAHALANTCRYTGHCKYFYSVAEHSVWVSNITGTLEGLLHDASEAYITDIASPVKACLADYKRLENLVMEAVIEKWNLDPKELESSVKEADIIQLSTEARHLIPSRGNDWNWDHIMAPINKKGRPKRFGIKPDGWSPNTAKARFLARYKELAHEIL